MGGNCYGWERNLWMTAIEFGSGDLRMSRRSHDLPATTDLWPGGSPPVPAHVLSRAAVFLSQWQPLYSLCPYSLRRRLRQQHNNVQRKPFNQCQWVTRNHAGGWF